MGGVARVPDVVGSTGYLLYKSGFLAQRGLDAAFEAAGLSYREFLVLAFAAANELSQQDIARRLSIDATLVVAVVDALEERGLVERTRDPRDRRRYVLVVTAEGRQVLATTAKGAAKTEAEFLAPLTPTKRKQLHELVREVLRPQLPWLED